MEWVDLEPAILAEAGEPDPVRYSPVRQIAPDNHAWRARLLANERQRAVQDPIRKIHASLT
jgi:hypothetical protein